MSFFCTKSQFKAVLLFIFLTACTNSQVDYLPTSTFSRNPITETPSSIAALYPLPLEEEVTPTEKNNVGSYNSKSTPSPTENALGLVSCYSQKSRQGTHVPTYPTEECVYEFKFPLIRPIESPGNDKVDVTYRYGNTQYGEREPHHGVEFINKAGVPVLAAADGRVIVAGSDFETVFAEKEGFYGKLVIIKHQIPGFKQPLFTLYGHLLTIKVNPGDKVQTGEPIGEVGLGGVAAGTHLHFEVRWLENTYDSTRNPELWLNPIKEDGSVSMGVLSGRVLDRNKNFIAIDNIVLESLDTTENSAINRIYLRTYEDPKMIGLQPWAESFAIGDLPAGNYRIKFINRRPIEYNLKILPGMITYLTFQFK